MTTASSLDLFGRYLLGLQPLYPSQLGLHLLSLMPGLNLIAGVAVAVSHKS